MRTRFLAGTIGALVGVLLLSSYAFADNLSMDVDDPSGEGDFETSYYLNVECRLVGVSGAAGKVTAGTPAVVGGVPTPGYHFSQRVEHAPVGCWCRNSETVPQNSCKDLQVKFSWP